METGPIFIGGLSFSGKTPLRLMLSSHPNIALTRRTYMWPRYYGHYGDLSRPENFERCLAAILRHKHTQALRPDPDRIRREFWQGAPTPPPLSLPPSERGEPEGGQARAQPSEAGRTQAAYARLFGLFQQHYAERLGKPRWGDQLGFIERYADPIFAAYPTAKMIHMIRDPRDRYEEAVISSRHRKGKVGWDMAKWLQSAGLARRNRQRYPDGYRIVRYETLVARPEDTLREICAFIDEDFVPAMLTLENAIRFGDDEDDGPSETPELRAAPAISNGDSGRAMSKREMAFTQTYAGPDMLALGYTLESIRLSLYDWLLFCLVDWPANQTGRVAWHALGARQAA